MRLQAATSLLHLSAIPGFQPEVNQYFVLIALTMQDSVYQVRMRFLDKLLTSLSKGKLPIQYNMIPFLCVHDPESDVKSKVRQGNSSIPITWPLTFKTQAQAYVAYALRAMPKGTSVATSPIPRSLTCPNSCPARPLRTQLHSITPPVGTSSRLQGR